MRSVSQVAPLASEAAAAAPPPPVGRPPPSATPIAVTAAAKQRTEDPTPPVTKYVRFFRREFDKMVFQGVLFGALSIIVQISSLAATWDRRTSWLRKVPCTFQDQLARFSSLTQAATRVIEFATVLPSIGFVAYGMWYLRPANRMCNDAAWKPLRTSTLGLLYCVKILVPVLVYSIINFKLPAYVPYAGMAIKACAVTASLAVYPPGREGTVIGATYDMLRLAHSNFLSNDANLEYGDVVPDMERSLSKLVNMSAGTPIDETDECGLLGAETTGPLKILNRFLSPPKPIDDFCKEAFRVGREDMGLSLSSALEFPLQVLSGQFAELFAAVPLTYYGCSRPMPETDSSPAPDLRLSFAELCTVFHSSKSFDSIDSKYKPFGVTEERWTKYAAEIARLDTEEERQWGCALFSGLLNPKTGFDPTASQLCPRWVSFQKEGFGSEEWDANDESLIALKSNPFVGAAVAGFYETAPQRRKWQTLAGVITNVTFALNYRGAISNETKTAVGRWSMNDPRALAQLGKDQLIGVMNRLSVLGAQAKTQTYDKVTQSLSELRQEIESSMSDTISTLNNSFTEAAADMSVSLMNATSEGVANILQVVKNQLQLLSYDIEFEVDSDWDLGNNGTQYDNDPCGKGGTTDGDYPADKDECEGIGSCVWAPSSSLCGYAAVTPVSFRREVLSGQAYRFTQTKEETEAAMTALSNSVFDTSTNGLAKIFGDGAGSAQTLGENAQDLVYTQFVELESFTMNTFETLIVAITQMANDLSITSAVGMLKTSQLVSEKTFEATNAAIRLVRYVIGTYIGFGVVSRLLPFAIAIVAGVQKGTKAFTKLTRKSGAFTVPGDSTSLQKFNALLLFISGLVVAVPMISITIFFYQSFADQYFVLVVLAMEIWAVGQAFKGFISKRKNQIVTGLAGVLGLSGFLCWAILDDNAMFVSEYLVMQGKEFLVGQSFVKILTLVANAGFNFFFSKVITAQLVSRLSVG